MPDSKSFSLVQMQQWMQDVLAHSENAVGEKVETEDVINASKKLSAQRHLNIYKNSYIARLRECMKNQFGALAYALGDELFQSFADDYLAVYPSASYTLNDLGKRFPDYLQETRPDVNQEIKESWPDFMIELAQFEFNLSMIFDETAEEKEEIISENISDEQLKLSPVFHLFRHRFPIRKYYLDYSAKKEPELPFEEESYCAVIRKNFRLGLFEIKPAQFAFLTYMKEGKSISDAMDEVGKTFQFDEQTKNGLWAEWKKNFIASDFFTSKS